MLPLYGRAIRTVPADGDAKTIERSSSERRAQAVTVAFWFVSRLVSEGENEMIREEVLPRIVHANGMEG
jgi:hypothetical protein